MVIVPRLTRREIEVVECIFKGMTSKIIARDLKISIHTVRKHRANLMSKVGARSEGQLLQFPELQVLCPKRHPSRA